MKKERGLSELHGRSIRTGTLGSIRASAALVRRTLPLLPIAPIVVVVASAIVTLAIGFFGMRELDDVYDERAQDLATGLVNGLAARMPVLSEKERLSLLGNAAKEGSSTLFLLDGRGAVLHEAGPHVDDAPKKMISVGKRSGRFESSGEDYFYSALPFQSGDSKGQLIAAVTRRAKNTAPSRELFSALLSFAVVLVGVAAAATHLVAREANDNVEYLSRRIRRMVDAAGNRELGGDIVPFRTMDEVGILTSAFNDLAKRFNEAEKRYQQNLEKADSADRDRASFLAAVSHELRSPLNAILGFADLLLQEVDGPLSYETREEVEQIRASGQHLSDLISDILEFSALEAGQLRLARSRIDASVIAESVIREAEVLLEGRPVTLRKEGESMLMLDADPKRLRQILTNLVANAIKFTSRGSVVLTTTKRGAFGRISVSDTGAGISAEEQALIFEDFRQAGSKVQRRRGTGLGLAIARRLVLMHGGSIEVESELGKGSTFHVFLPLGNDSFFARKNARGEKGSPP